ncbi:hypothetical protein EVAR_99919_1 [Eumeta japonica]|uniref:Uncharacterized protein n=1 Tax=Eumeta variegata TaxID=151549 RepID=A0A4C1Z1A7_EUMVA|nr:hypothetical protein EVAR_99919_1 [Eumeta japonica]
MISIRHYIFSSTETKNSSTPSGRGRARPRADISINKCPVTRGRDDATVVSSVIKCPLHATPTSPRNKLRQNLNTRKPLDTPAFAPSRSEMFCAVRRRHATVSKCLLRKQQMYVRSTKLSPPPMGTRNREESPVLCRPFRKELDIRCINHKNGYIASCKIAINQAIAFGGIAGPYRLELSGATHPLYKVIGFTLRQPITRAGLYGYPVCIIHVPTQSLLCTPLLAVRTPLSSAIDHSSYKIPEKNVIKCAVRIPDLEESATSVDNGRAA